MTPHIDIKEPSAPQEPRKPAAGEGYVPLRSSRFRYRTLGSGPRLTVCFHGFGESADHFAHLSERLPDHTLVAIDMPFHGSTEWNEKDGLRIHELSRILSECPAIGDRPFGVLGYSMGGKMALSMAQVVPERITHLCLVAADGLRWDPWHWFCTRTLPGKRLLERTVEDPGRMLTLLELFRKAGWVNQSAFKFVSHHLQDPALRRTIQGTWMSLREFTPDTGLVLRNVKRQGIPVCMVYGRYDRLAPQKQGEAFFNNLGGLGWMKTVESGHMLLGRQSAADTAAAILSFLNEAKPRSG